MDLRPIKPLEETEKAEILNAILVTEGNVSKAARELGISESRLYERLKEYDCRPVTIRRILKAQGKLPLGNSEIQSPYPPTA